MSVDLKPCPFCGSDKIYREATITDGSVWCHEGCRAKITYKHSPGKEDGMEEAISAWNRRPTPKLRLITGCEGLCGPHEGEVKKYEIVGCSFKADHHAIGWTFWYCDAAVAEDRKTGFILVEKDEWP